MAQQIAVRLSRHDAQPWGFRLQGGKDFGTPLVVQKVSTGSLADNAGLIPGDAVISVNNVDVFNMRHKDAQDVLVRSGNSFEITIQRGGSTWRPAVTPTGSIPTPSSQLGYVHPVTRTSLAHRPQEVHHIGSGYNNSARPFTGVNGTDGHVKSIVNKQYNTPVGIYSEESIAETLSAQAEVLAGGVLGVNFKKNEKIYNSANSEVLKMLHEQENDPEPADNSEIFSPTHHNYQDSHYQKQQQQQQYHQQHQQHQQHQHQQQQQQQHYQQQQQYQNQQYHQQHQAPASATKHVTAPINRPQAPNTGGIPAGQNICAECERLIVGVFVRIKDKNLHVDCFRCATCGTSLKNAGYFNFNNKLYCDIHAKMAAIQNPPAGTEGYVPVPIKANQKLSASTISAALNAHGLHTNGSAHTMSSPPSHPEYGVLVQDTNTTVPTISSPLPQSHSRTSSSSSSSAGTTNSYISSLSPSKSLSPEKLSPAHSRQSSESGVVVTGNNNSNSTSVSKSQSPSFGQFTTVSSINIENTTASEYPLSTQNITNSPYTTNQNTVTSCNGNGVVNIQVGGNEISINQKQNENDMNSTNRRENGAPPAPQTSTYNQFLQKYANKKLTDITDGGNKSSSIADINVNGFNSTNTGNITEQTKTPPDTINNNGYGNIGTTKPTESIYGTIRPNTKIQPNEDFQYITLQGSVIKSVIPPGKGIKTNYKVNTSYGGPKPFNTGSMGPPQGGPRSPTSYPPPSQAPSWIQAKPQPKPAVNPYATLPRATAASQEEADQYYESHSEQVHHEQHAFMEDLEVAEANSKTQKGGTFNWPPVAEDGHCTPTASPLYIPPPGTQHVVPKKIERTEVQHEDHEHKEVIQQQQQLQQQQLQQHQLQQHQLQQQQLQQQQLQQQQLQQQWQSRSAPELTAGLSAKHQIEIESSSDSYTSTCTTTTTTSEEYQRMYQAQVQAYQMQQMYDQSGSEMDYHMDMEVAAMQQQNQSIQQLQDQSFSSAIEHFSSHSGRRSVQECATAVAGPISTYHLIDMVREATPKPETPPPRAHRRVEFAEDVQEKKEEVAQEEICTKEQIKIQKDSLQNASVKEEEHQQQEKKETKQTISEPEVPRKFAPTPEIIIDIPETKPLPPTNIPNPVPKEWISPMVKALTTAPDKPVKLPEMCIGVEISDSAEYQEMCTKKESSVIREVKAPHCGEYHEPETKPVKAEILAEPPAKGSFIASAMSTAPQDSIKFAPHPSDLIMLPEETEPYMPPPIDMKPYEREDIRPKSPMLKALTTAPDQPYNPFGHDVCSQLLDMPMPKEKLTMVDALTVASDRGYTPLNTDNALNLQLEEQKPADPYDELRKKIMDDVQKSQNMVENLDVHMDREISAFSSNIGGSCSKTSQACTKASRDSIVSSMHRVSLPSFDAKSDAVATTHRDSVVSNPQTLSFADHRDSLTQTSLPPRSDKSAIDHQVLNESSAMQVDAAASFHKATTQFSSSSSSSYHHSSMSRSQQTHHESASKMVKQSSCTRSSVECEQKSQETEQKLSFPPPCDSLSKKALLLSGLHKPERIPQYQRNWTVLPSQRPVKTPEPQELRENVPLAFLDAPKQTSPYVQTSMTSTFDGSAASNVTRINESNPIHQEQKQQSVPAIFEDRSGPITMTFQSLDDQPKEDHSHLHPRPFTPSLINKAAPIVPFYQHPDNLVMEECSARTSHAFNPRSPSPCPDRAKSPAPGPPANPLTAIRAPRIKDVTSVESMPNYRPIQAGSITTGQSYFGSQALQQHHGQVLSHYETMSQSGGQSLIDKPEVVQQKQIGDVRIQTREKESHLSEEKHSALQSKTTTQIGNTQIERRRKVVEEYEHTQSAKTIEIQKSSGQVTSTSTGGRQIGKTGFVANQARRLSGLEQEITNMSSQSQAITARAATLGSTNNIPVPPPMPNSVLRKEIAMAAANVAKENIRNKEEYRPGQATDMLAKSLEEVNVNDRDKFRSQVGQVLSNMLEARLAKNKLPIDIFGQTKSASPSQSPSKPHPFRNILETCDKPTKSMEPRKLATNNVLATNNLVVAPNTVVVPNTMIAPNTVVVPNTMMAPNTVVVPNTMMAPNTVVVPNTMMAANNVMTANNMLAPNNHVVPKNNIVTLSTVVAPNTVVARNNIVTANNVVAPNNVLATNNHVVSKNTVVAPNTVVASNNVVAPNTVVAPSNVVFANNAVDTNEKSANLPKVEFTVALRNDGANKVEPVHDSAVSNLPKVEFTVELRNGGAKRVEPAHDSVDDGEELKSFESVIFRNKPSNPSGRRELSSHAVDRRSYIEKDSVPKADVVDSDGAQSDEMTTTLVEGLKEGKQPACCQCNARITRGPFITALGRIWCPDHFICVNANCRRALQDIGFVEEKGDLYCEYCFEKYLAPTCSKCQSKIKGDCLNAIGKHYHPECFTCSYCGKLFGNSPFFLEEGEPYCEADWNELFTTKCFACGFPVEAGDRWVEALNHNYHSQCFNCTMCKKNLEGQSFYNKGGRPFCKNHAR